MKPIVTTARALRELSTTGDTETLRNSGNLYLESSSDAEFIIHAQDRDDAQRVVIDRTGNNKDTLLPDALVKARRESIGRLAAFADRAATPAPLSLPHGWGQFKRDNFIAFAALPVSANPRIRWIAEVTSDSRSDCYMRRTTSDQDKSTIEAYIAENEHRPMVNEATWTAVFGRARDYFSAIRVVESTDVDITLSTIDTVSGVAWDYDTWMSQLSADQAAFVQAPTDRSIRLRGPAGSGKTLALTLKAVGALRSSEEPVPRVLIVTHSWALATQVQRAADLMGTNLENLDVFPLLAIAEDVLPVEYIDSAVELIGDDNLSGKQAQLDEILETLVEFRLTDWVTFRANVSPNLRSRFDSENADVQLGLAWDLLIEFGSVIGAQSIFPGAGSELKYQHTVRAPWMMPLETRADRRVVFEVYSRYMSALERRGVLTSDQLLADFVSYLESHAWNRRRKTEGYDLVFVDEFHLFSPLERQALHYLNKDVLTYPKLFMAADPSQAPSSAFIGSASDESVASSPEVDEATMGDVSSYDLINVHRFTPEILDLVRHVHLEFPTIMFGHDWDIDFSRIQSSLPGGTIPQLISCGGRESELRDIYGAVAERYHEGTIAIAVVDTRQWSRYSDFAANLGQSGKYHVRTVTGRSDADGLNYRHRGVVVGTAEHLAGLQFAQVFAVGLSDMRPGSVTPADRTRLLSMLYLALSRAQSRVEVFVNEDDGGTPDVLVRASAAGIILSTIGSQV